MSKKSPSPVHTSEGFFSRVYRRFRPERADSLETFVCSTKSMGKLCHDFWLVSKRFSIYFHSMKPLALALVFWAVNAPGSGIDPRQASTSYSSIQTVKPATATMLGAKQSFVAAQPPPQNVITMAADFEPTQISNLWAFCEVKTDMTNAWGRIATMPYPASGGTFALSYTNASPTIYFRFGYQFSR